MIPGSSSTGLRKKTEGASAPRAFGMRNTFIQIFLKQDICPTVVYGTVYNKAMIIAFQKQI